jgi:hypothetical protein
MVLLAVSGSADTWDPAATALTIEVRRAPGLEPDRYTLACDPPAGTVSDPAGACRRIAALVEARVEVWLPEMNARCELVYGGPEVMVVQGRLAGHSVDGRYTREDGCAMSGYDEMARVLGVPASGASPEAAAAL